MTAHDSLDVTNTYVAADAIAQRNPALARLINRLVPGGISNEDWLDIVATSINAIDEHDEAVREYPSTYPRSEAADRDAGDRPRPAGWNALVCMSSGERAMLRLIATLSDARVRWHAQDITGDHDTEAVLRDWAHVVRNRIQIPAWL